MIIGNSPVRLRVKEYSLAQISADPAQFFDTETSYEELRYQCQLNPVVTVMNLAEDIFNSGVFCTPLTFCSEVKSKLLQISEGRYLSCLEIIWCCDFIMDLVTRDKLVSTKEYIETLEALNPQGIGLIPEKSIAYNDKGIPFIPTIQWLKEYKY